MGEMADALFEDDPFDDEKWECPTAKLVTCNRCGEEDLHWEEMDGRYRLFGETANLHVCDPYDKGFEAL